MHNQDGIIVNDFGEEVILRGWGMGNWDNPEGFMLGTQSGFGLFEPGKYAPMGRMDRGRSMDQILRRPAERNMRRSSGNAGDGCI